MKKQTKSLILFGTIIFIGYMLMAFDLFSVSVYGFIFPVVVIFAFMYQERIG